jgi:hypothetical protein
MANEQSWDNQQLALTQQAMRQQQAEQRASEQLNRAAKNRPGGENDVTNPEKGLPKINYCGLPGTGGGNVKSRGKKG